MVNEEFRAYVQARLPWMSRIAFLLTGNHHAAEDLLQNALIKVAANWAKVAAADQQDAYVRRLLYNEHVSGWRRAKHAQFETSTDEVPERRFSRDEVSNSLRRIMLEQALAKLAPKQRAVIVLRYFEDLDEAATAQALGCSIGNVKSQSSRAIDRLRVIAPELIQLMNDNAEVAA
jgi:RNA polymerase sigma-70 factor (sigma-E family)